MKTQIKINQSNTKTDSLTKIETFIKNSLRKTLPNLKITQTQQLELKTQIKTNQSNNNIDPLTKIDTQIRVNKEETQNNTCLATRIENL